MAWFALIAAGLLEVTGAVGLKFTQGFTRAGYTARVIIGFAASFYLLSCVAEILPIGTAYAVWTGIGAAGAAVFGIMFLGEPINLGRIVSLCLVIGGSVGIKLFS